MRAIDVSAFGQLRPFNRGRSSSIARPKTALDQCLLLDRQPEKLGREYPNQTSIPNLDSPVYVLGFHLLARLE